MANILIYKTKPTVSVDSVERDLENAETSQTYTDSREFTATIAASGGTTALPSPASMPSTTPFIEIRSNQAVDITFKDAATATISALTAVFFQAGNIKGYDFNLTNNSTEDATIYFKIFW